PVPNVLQDNLCHGPCPQLSHRITCAMAPVPNVLQDNLCHGPFPNVLQDNLCHGPCPQCPTG
ncbi:hypothetical protein Nmel_017466, partial [Mimus melanotis]